MARHTFTAGAAQQLVVPATTPLDLQFTLAVPSNWTPSPGQATRLLHVRTPGGTKPRTSEVFELKVSANKTLVIERSGFGNRQPEFLEPVKMDLPADGRYRVTFSGGSLTVNGQSTTTHLKPANGAGLELVFGFDLNTESLVPPIGWVLDMEGIPETPGQPPAEPPAPPVDPPLLRPPAPPSPTAPPPNDNARDAFIHDLQALAIKYASARGIDPAWLLLLQLLIDRAK